MTSFYEFVALGDTPISNSLPVRSEKMWSYSGILRFIFYFILCVIYKVSFLCFILKVPDMTHFIYICVVSGYKLIASVALIFFFLQKMLLLSKHYLNLPIDALETQACATHVTNYWRHLIAVSNFILLVMGSLWSLWSSKPRFLTIFIFYQIIHSSPNQWRPFGSLNVTGPPWSHRKWHYWVWLC